MKGARLTHVKEALLHNVQCVWEFLITGLIKGVQQFFRGVARVYIWGIAGVDIVRNGITRGVAQFMETYSRRGIIYEASPPEMPPRPHPYNRFWAHKSFPHSTKLRVLAGITLVIVVVLALWKIPQWQVADSTLSAKERIELQDKARGTLAQIFGGIVILCGLYYTGRSVAAVWRNVQITQEGQITERFTRAIDQLGSDKIAICLGGIYALERIARDSAKDYWPIMEVLTAYVREKASWSGGQQSQKNKSCESGDPTPVENVQSETPQPPKVAPVIQAILTVIGRRTHQDRDDEEPWLKFFDLPVVEKWLDLHGTDLRGADLDDTHLEGAILRDTCLEGAYLRRADLRGACLQHADLRGANLQFANLRGADLQGANLQYAVFHRVNLCSANLRGADLQGANLQYADLSYANLRDVDLRGADFTGADLTSVHFESVDLTGARFQHAKFKRANLQHANLQHVELQDVSFTNADLQFANLEGAALHRANLQFAHLQAAKLDGAALHRVNLQFADLRGAYLQGVHLDQANLQFANFRGADLRGAYLQGVIGLRKEQIASAYTDATTRLPDYLIADEE